MRGIEGTFSFRKGGSRFDFRSGKYENRKRNIGSKNGTRTFTMWSFDDFFLQKKIQKIHSKFDEAMNQILSKYPKAEPLSWPILAPQAKRWIYASAEERESLKSEIISLISESKSQDDEDITELASSILTKSNVYESFGGVCKKLKREMILQIENNTKTNVNVLYNELEVIVIDFLSFEGVNHG